METQCLRCWSRSTSLLDLPDDVKANLLAEDDVRGTRNVAAGAAPRSQIAIRVGPGHRGASCSPRPCRIACSINRVYVGEVKHLGDWYPPVSRWGRPGLDNGCPGDGISCWTTASR